MVRRRHDDGVEVLLVEDDAQADDGADGTTSTPGPPRASWRLPAGLPWRPVLGVAPSPGRPLREVWRRSGRVMALAGGPTVVVGLG